MRHRIIVLALGLLLPVLLLAAACGGEEYKAPAPAPTTAAPATQPAATGTGIEVKVVHKENPYQFEPKDLTFEKGKTYTLVMGPLQTEYHTFTVDDLKINVALNSGESKRFTFTPDKTGTFKLICIPHQALGMTGTVTVK